MSGRNQCRIIRKLVKIAWLAGLCVAAAGCGSSTFDGSRVESEDAFYMDYSVLAKKEEASLELEEGDVLKVDISQDKGSVDICIGRSGEEPIYEGNSLVEMSFTLNITEAGEYQISVSGNRASGSVAFTKLPAEKETDDGQRRQEG